MTSGNRVTKSVPVTVVEHSSERPSQGKDGIECIQNIGHNEETNFRSFEDQRKSSLKFEY